MTDLFENTPVEGETAPIDHTDIIKAKFSKDGVVDVEALVKAKAESDRFIEQLKEENKGVRDEMNKRTSFDELIARLEQQKSSTADADNQAAPPEKNDDIPNKVLDNSAIEAIVAKTLTRKTQEANQVKNISDVRAKLEAEWGKDHVKKLETVIADLDLTKDEAGKLAAERPKAFLKLVLGDKNIPQTGIAPPQSSVRFEQRPNTGIAKGFSQYQKMMTDPDPKVRNLYWSPKVQNEMHKLVQEHGEAFLKS